MNKLFYGHYWRDAKGELQPLYAPAYHVIATSCIPRVPCIATGTTKRQATNEALKLIHWYGEDAIYRSKNP